MALIKVQFCKRCSDAYLEGKQDMHSRNLRKEVRICPDCKMQYEEFKKKNNIPKLAYIGQDEPIPF